MRILLLGEYSNVHNTLARGLRELGHEVVVASDGDHWKNYPRQIDLYRDMSSRLKDVEFFVRLLKNFRHFRGYDVVQLINPVFVNLKAERLYPFYNYLRRHNRHVVMGAFGMDHYYVKACLDFTTFRYSDFNIGPTERLSGENDIFKRDWLHGEKGRLNKFVAHDCDAIVAGLYEYYASYAAHFSGAGKLHFIPFPIVCDHRGEVIEERPEGAPVRFFIGIQKERSVYKGTDIMLRALLRLKRDFPEACEILKAESVPFARYVEMMHNSDVIIDQLYSYTPAMNALEGMSRGLIAVSGGEPENYDIISEHSLRPIINVQPTEDDVYSQLRHLVVHRDELVPLLRRQSMEYVRRHHDHLKVAQKYEALYRSLDKQS